MKFTKLQGAGNDFILVDAGDVQRDWSPVARAICDRHFGVGGDGLLLLLPSAVADFKMRIFNSDGSEAEICGNGLRCLAKYLVDNRLNGEHVGEITVETQAGIRRIKLQRAGKETKIQVGMGEPRFGARDIPVVIEGMRRDSSLDITPIMDYHVTVDGIELYLSLVSMGNPHAVHFTRYPVSEFPLAQLGPKIEQHKIFPQRTNFEVARIISRKSIEARVWERGVGETLACGSGACAVVVAAQLHRYIDNKAAIELPGGVLELEWDGRGEILLSGPVQTVFTGDWLE